MAESTCEECQTKITVPTRLRSGQLKSVGTTAATDLKSVGTYQNGLDKALRVSPLAVDIHRRAVGKSEETSDEPPQMKSLILKKTGHISSVNSELRQLCRKARPP